MAEDTRQANVVLTADTSQYSQQIMAASAQTNQATTSVEKLINSMDRLQRSVSRRLDIISAVSITGITAATLAAAKFESQMETLQATAAITGKNFNLVEKSVDSLRRTLPVSTEQIVQLVGALQKMGVSTPKVKELAETFIKLGASTGEDIGALTTNLVGLQRAMGTTESSISSFADQTAHLSATLGVSATGVLQFANSLAPVARTVGMTQTEVMGFSAAFVKSGQDSTAAANVMTKLVTDVSRATRYGSTDIYAYANAVGMTAEQFKKLPAAEQTTAFFTAISRQGADAIKTLERMGYDGPRALKAIQGLAQSGGLNQAMNTAQEGYGNGANEKGAKAAMDGLNDSLKQLQNTLTSIGQAFGKTFLPFVTKAVDAVNLLARGIRSLMDPLQNMLSKFALIGAAVSGVASVATSGIGILAAAGGAYALLRNPLTAGFMSRRAERTGRDMSAFTRNTSANMAARGTPFQRMLFGWGQGAATRLTSETAGPRQNAWQRARAAVSRAATDTANNAREDVRRAAAYRTATFFRSGDPLLPGQINAQGERKYPWLGARFGRPVTEQMLPTREAGDTFRRGLHLGNIPGRVAMAGAAVVQSGLGLVRSQIDPIRWAGSMDATARPGYQDPRIKDNFRRAWTGEGAGIGTAIRGTQASLVRFGKSLLDAGAGLTRLATAAGRAAIAPAIRGAMTNIGGVARGAVGLMGGPIGIAMMAGFGAVSLAGQANQNRDAFRERLGASTAEDSAINKYATSLGVAGSAAMNFADTVNSASKAIEVTSPEQARKITGEDITAATMKGRKLSDKSIEGMSEQQAAAYATSVYGRSDTDPKIMQAMKLDLLQEFQGDQKVVENIMAAASGKSVSGITAPQLGDLVESFKEPSNPFASNKGDNGNFFTAGFKPGKSLEDSLSQVESAYSTMASYTTTQFGQKETDKLTSAVLNQIIGKFDKNQTNVQGGALANTLEEISGVKNLKIGMGDIHSLQNAGDSFAKIDAFYDIVEKSGEKGQILLDMRERLGNSYQTSYNAPAAGTQADLYKKMGVYDTTAGRLFGGQGALSEQLRNAMGQPENANVVLEAGTALAAKLREMTGSVAGADAALQQLKATVGDPSNPIYQIATLGQSETARIGGFESGHLSQRENARRSLLAVTAAQNFTGPDAEERRQAVESEYKNQGIALHQQLTSMMKAFQDFDRQRGRATENFNLQRARGEEQFALQQQYQQADYDKQRQRSQEAYDLQRHRSEEDHQHQIEQQIKQAAQTIQSTYERITTKATWDTQNLLVNAGEQAERMRQQQRDLATARSMGLSGDAISNLGLNDFSNQQQLARMISDFASNPDLVRQLNESVQGKLDLTKAFVMDPDSEAWKESQRAYQQGMDRMAEDKEKVNKQGETDYAETLQRQKAAHALALKQTFEDFQRGLDQAADDMNRSFEDLTTDFNTTAATVLDKLTGTSKTQYEELIGSLSKSKTAISGALTDTNSEVIKQLAPLFGGEEAARKALQMAANAQQSSHAPGGQFAVSGPNGGNATRPPGGGPSGSEYSYDAMSSYAGGGMGGPGGANFPLPAGTWHKSSGFGMRTNPVSGIYRLHSGTDLAARQGTPIGAAQDGVVTRAGASGGLGNMVEVSHGDGTKTWYGHMSLITAKKDQIVSAGQQIGLVGSTGNSTGPHLHFERRINGNPVDPWGYLQGLQSGQITGAQTGFMADMGPATRNADITKGNGIKTAEAAFMSMVPGGDGYTPGMFTNALQTRVNQVTGGAVSTDIPMDSIGGAVLGNYASMPQRGGGYARGGVVMDTRSVTTIQHIDQGTDFHGGIVVMAQDPNEMGRKLAEKKRMKALTRPTRS